MEVELKWHLMCRTCLTQFLDQQNLKPLYDLNQSAHNDGFEQKLKKYTSIQLNRETLPNMICSDCVQKLQIVCDFYETCEKSDAILKELITLTIKQEETASEITNILNMQTDTDVFSYVLPKGLKIKKLDKEELSDDTKIAIEQEFFDSVVIKEENESSLTQPEINYTDPNTNALDVETQNQCFLLIDNNVDNVTEFLQQTPSKCIPIDLLEMGSVSNINDQVQPITKQAQSPRRISSVKRAILQPIKRHQRHHVCNLCGRSYRFPHLLNTHVKRHLEDKAYCCDVCGKRFVIPFELKRHQRIHNGYKPYKCQYCEREFSDISSKTKHERTHTGFRPYKCQHCSKSFSYSHVLSNHLLTHSGERKYQCEICLKRFVKNHHLKTHMKTHDRPIQQTLDALELTQSIQALPQLVEGDEINILTQLENYQLVEVFDTS